MGQSLKLGLLSLRNEFKSGSNHSVRIITRMCNPTMLKCCRKKEQCMPARLDPCARDDGERMRCCMPAVISVSILLNRMGDGVVCSTMLCTSELSDRASDGSDLISAMSGSRSLVAEIRSEPLDARSDGSEVRSTDCTAPTQSPLLNCVSLVAVFPELSWELGQTDKMT